MDKKVSIIVPIYKVEKYLSKCIESLINQTYQNLEIVLVNDGSPDNCSTICDDYAKKDKRIMVIHKENGGVMSAWIEGVKQSTGELITFLDGDDYFELIAIETMVNNLNNADMLVCGYNLIYSNPHKNISMPALKNQNNGEFKDNAIEEFKKYNCLRPNSYMQLFKGNKIYKRELIINNLKYCDLRVSFGDDCCVVLGAVLDSKSIVVINDALYNYLQRETSIVHNYNFKLIKNCEILNEKFNSMLSEKGYYYQQGIVFEKVRLLFILCQNIFYSKLTKKEKKEQFNNVQKSILAQSVKHNKETNRIKRTYKIFYKVFKSNNYFINNCFMKLVNKIKK